MKKILSFIVISSLSLGTLLFSSMANAIDHQAIHLLAGYGTGDNYQANQARLMHPSDVAFDAQGNIFISERANHRIRKIDAQGIIHSIAGLGSAGYTGDGQLAVNAKINTPMGLIFDTFGNLLFADQKNHVIRKIDTQGQITTFAGKGHAGDSGDGGLATDAELNLPTDIAIDAQGNVYIADRNNHRIRKINPEGIITTFAGTGKQGATLSPQSANQSELFYPSAITFDDQDHLLVADSANNRILQISHTGNIRQIVGTDKQGKALSNGKKAINTPLHYPNGIAFSASQGIYIADSWNNQIIHINPTGTASILFQDEGLDFPTQLAIDHQGVLYIADSRHHRLLKTSQHNTLSLVAGKTPTNSPDTKNAQSAWLDQPTDLLLDPQGNIFIVDKRNHQIRKISPMGIITTVAGTGKAGRSGDGGLATQATLRHPHAIALDTLGNLYIADTLNHRIRKVTPDGIIHTIAGTVQGFSGDSKQATDARLSYPVALTVATDGTLYIADQRNHRVRMIDPSGMIHTIAGNGKKAAPVEGALARQTALLMPSGLALDQQQQLYISDAATHKVYQLISANQSLPLGSSRYDSNQNNTAHHLKKRIISIAGTGWAGFSNANKLARQTPLNSPHGLVVDQQNRLIIADTGNHRIRLLDHDGKLQTLAGSLEGYAGDGNDDTLRLSHPEGVFVASDNTLMIADTGNDRIRYLTTEKTSSPTLTAQLDSSKTVSLNWASPNQTTGGYWLERKATHDTDFQQLAVLPANQTHYRDQQLLPNTRYRYRIRHYSPLSLFSPYSNLSQINMPENHQPNPTMSIITSQSTLGVIYHFTGQANSKDGVKSWYWTFDDGMGSADQNPLHHFATQGEHEITLTVTDKDGDTRSLKRTLNIGNVRFNVLAGDNLSVNEGENIRFNGQFSHPKRDESPLITWNFGDGQAAAGSLTPSHQYTTPGIYQATLMVMDSHGKTQANHLSVTVANLAPSVSLGNDYQIRVGESFSLTANASDPGKGKLSYQWDFGDGHQQTGGNSLDYQYLTPGVYQITLEVTDAGNKKASDSVLVHVFQKQGQVVTQALDYKDLRSQGRHGSALLISHAGPAHLYLSNKKHDQLQQIDFGTDFVPLAIRSTRDLNNDGVEELVVMGLSQRRQSIDVRMIDPLTRLTIKKYELGLPETHPNSQAPSVRMEQTGKHTARLSYEVPLP